MSATALLVFARCAGFAFRAPGIAHPSVPHPVRAAFAATIAIALSPGAQGRALSAVVPLTLQDGVLVASLALEFLIGTAVGLAASAIYDAAYAGGRVVDDYTGVKAIAPGATLVAPSGFGRVWSLAFTGAFFLLGAYRVVLLAFAASFDRLPPGAALDAPSWERLAASLASTIFATAFAVAAPSVALAFLVQFALGALARAVPRFGSVTLAFPLVLAAALLATGFAMPALIGAAGHPWTWLP